MTSLQSSFHYKSKVILFTKKNNDLALPDWPAVPPVNRWVQIIHCVAHLAKFELKSHTGNVWKACRDTAHSVSRYFSYLVLFGSLSRTDGSSGTESQQSPDLGNLSVLSFNSNGDQTPPDWVCWPLCTSHIPTHTLSYLHALKRSDFLCSAHLCWMKYSWVTTLLWRLH